MKSQNSAFWTKKMEFTILDEFWTKIRNFDEISDAIHHFE